MCMEQLGSYAFIDFAESKNLVKDVQAATEDGLGPHAVILVAVNEKPFQQAAEVSYLESLRGVAWANRVSHPVRPPSRHSHLHRPPSGRLSTRSSLRVRHQDDHHQGLVRRQPEGHVRGARLLPPGAHQGTIQDCRAERAAVSVSLRPLHFLLPVPLFVMHHVGSAKGVTVTT